MSDQRETSEIAGAVEQLDDLCAKVGLARAAQLPDAEEFASPPRGTVLWTSTYAHLLLWPCPASDPASVEAAARTGQAWFDEVLVQGELQMEGRPIDGYLVLALPRAPDEDSREDVRRLELSAQVCRKHLIWPSASGEPDHEPGRWRRVADVTVLGLPDTEMATGAELQWPEIDAEAQSLWDDLASIGVSATVIQDEAS